MQVVRRGRWLVHADGQERQMVRPGRWSVQVFYRVSRNVKRVFSSRGWSGHGSCQAGGQVRRVVRPCRRSIPVFGQVSRVVRRVVSSGGWSDQLIRSIYCSFLAPYMISVWKLDGLVWSCNIPTNRPWNSVPFLDQPLVQDGLGYSGLTQDAGKSPVHGKSG